MKNITKEEMELLEGCQSAQEWGRACDRIKKARDGEYPPDWWGKVKLSGMMDRILARWGRDSSLTLAPFKFTTDGKDRTND